MGIARLDTDRRISTAVGDILMALGEDGRSGTSDTPARVARFLAEFCNPEPFDWTTFASEGMDEMVVQAGIPFYSLCEHHLLPFFGTACVAYIPAGKLVGLSKLARNVRYYASGLMNQERITLRVADEMERQLRPLGVGVVLRARHMCMEMRGIRSHDTWTTTSRLTGSIRDDPKARAEFLALARGIE